jgi:3-oxoacyl-[acyl-carrier protein] reductase
MQIIRGRRALVTGAASGIGRAVALALAREGAELFLVDVRRDDLEGVAEEARKLGVIVIASVHDLSEPAEVSAVAHNVLTAWGDLNILVNNAGIAHYGKLHEVSDEQWNRVMATNLLAPIQLTRALLPTLVAAEEAHILNMCSLFGITPWRKTAAYQTSKHGLVGFTAALRAEYCRKHFGVTALCPGFVDSPLLDRAGSAGEQKQKSVRTWIAATPEVVAVRAIEAIRRNPAMVVITPHAHFYWRFVRFFPRLSGWLLRRGWRKQNERIAL